MLGVYKSICMREKKQNKSVEAFNEINNNVKMKKKFRI